MVYAFLFITKGERYPPLHPLPRGDFLIPLHGGARDG